MKNKTLTLIFSVILLASMLMACGTAITKEEAVPTKIEHININDINDVALNKAISKSILTTAERLDDSELSTQGHVVLGSEIEENIVTVYVIASVSNYGIQNETLTCVSGTSVTPTVISFDVNPENDRYTEIEYKEPTNIKDFHTNVLELFPEKYHETALNDTNLYSDIEKMQLEQAAEYLTFINRDIPIKNHIIKESLPILENKTFSKEAPNFPTWDGSLELFENGKRYIYTSEPVTSNGYNVIICTKINENGNILKKFVIDKNGDLINLLEENSMVEDTN